MNFPYGNIEAIQEKRKIMNKKGYGVVELVVILAVFSVGYFVAANTISKELNVNYKETLYENKIAAIESQAEIYGKSNEEIFKDGNSVYMTIAELASANVVLYDKEGVVTDPRDEENDLNNLKVKITNENDLVTAKVLS